MKKLRPRIVHSLILVFFTISSFATFLTESFSSSQVGYSPILITLPPKYEKKISSETKIFFYEACESNETCSLPYLLIQSSILISFFVFYTSSLLLKSFAVYSGIGYIVLNTVYIILSFVYSDRYLLGISIYILNIIIAAILVFLTRNRLNFDKNIVEYDVVHNSISSIPGSAPNSARGYAGQLNDSQLDLNDLSKKVDEAKGKYKNIKMRYKESRSVIANLKEDLEESNKKYKILEENYKNFRSDKNKSSKGSIYNPKNQESADN